MRSLQAVMSGMRIDRTIAVSLGRYTEPNFIIAGTQKGGTTSLYSHLVRHPSVKVATQKEVHFFDLNYSRGRNWYRKQFPTRCANDQITGEASPYYLFHPEVPKRVVEMYPDIKVIAVLRNPVDRAYSHYNHNVRKGRETSTFEDAIAREMPAINGTNPPLLTIDDPYSHQHFSYLSRGMYSTQLRRWYEYFDQNQILVLKSEDLFSAPEQELAKVTKFLGLSVSELPRDGFARTNVGTYVSPIGANTRKQLSDLFRPHNIDLHELIGIDITQWHVC